MGQCCSDSLGKVEEYYVAISQPQYQPMDAVRDNKFDLFQRLVQTRIASGRPYTDPDFKPNSLSLFDPENDQGDATKFNRVQWKRASEIF